MGRGGRGPGPGPGPRTGAGMARRMTRCELAGCFGTGMPRMGGLAGRGPGGPGGGVRGRGPFGSEATDYGASVALATFWRRRLEAGAPVTLAAILMALMPHMPFQ